MKSQVPILSISCITYNHASYIRQCLDGFMIQKCNFSFEVLIHDDASTDGTQNIIEEYQAKYPDVIKPIFQTENQYSKGVRGIMARFNFPRAKGRYIALCEGDDYWTDPFKLQKQVDFLEHHPDYSACFHSVLNYDSVINKSSISTEFDKNHFDLTDLSENVLFRTLSCVFRNSHIGEKCEIIKNLPVGDYPLFILLADEGKINYFNEQMGVYRIHEGGTWNSIALLERQKKMLEVAEYFLKYFKNSQQEDGKVIYNFKFRKKLCLEGMIEILIEQKNYNELLTLLKRYYCKDRFDEAVMGKMIDSFRMQNLRLHQFLGTTKGRWARKGYQVLRYIKLVK